MGRCTPVPMIHRRSFLQALSALAAALVLPPLRVARAVRNRVQPYWPGTLPRWEHGKGGTRVLRAASRGPTQVDDDYEAALRDAGDPDDLLPTEVHPEEPKLTLKPDGQAVWGYFDPSWRQRSLGLSEEGQIGLYYPDDPKRPAARERYLARLGVGKRAGSA